MKAPSALRVQRRIESKHARRIAHEGVADGEYQTARTMAK
jgi:hypothetical protein